MTQDLKNKICVITGASSGIGEATALGLAKHGAQLVLLCRDLARGTKVAEEIRAKVNGARVEVSLADLANALHIKRFCHRFSETYPRLDVLINNAGVLLHRRQTTQDGFEVHFAVNHLAPFLLTNLLRDSLAAAPAARGLNVASGLHSRGRIDFGNLQAEHGFRSLRAYANSKLATVMFTYELARRWSHTRITANSLHPGVVATNLFPVPFRRVFRRLAALVLATPEQGAATSIYLATSSDVSGVTGKYFVDRRETRSSDASYDAKVAQHLWQVSSELVGLEDSPTEKDHASSTMDRHRHDSSKPDRS